VGEGHGRGSSGRARERGRLLCVTPPGPRPPQTPPLPGCLKTTPSSPR
jgi:hypothetical protein